MSPHGNPKVAPRIIGIGSLGIKALNHIIESGIKGNEIIAVEVDREELKALKTGEKISVMPELKIGLDGPSPDALHRKIDKERERIVDLMQGAETAILVSGIGGNTDTIVSLVAGIARKTGLFTVAVMSKPFRFEGRQRLSKAEKGLEELRRQVDSLIVVPGDSILPLTGKRISLPDALHAFDEILSQAVETVYYLFLPPEDALIYDGHLLKEILKGAVDLRIGIGEGQGKDHIAKSIKRAASSPLLEQKSPVKPDKVAVSIIYGEETTLNAVQDAVTLLEELAGKDAQIVFTTHILPGLRGRSRVGLILPIRRQEI